VDKIGSGYNSVNFVNSVQKPPAHILKTTGSEFPGNILFLAIFGVFGRQCFDFPDACDSATLPP